MKSRKGFTLIELMIVIAIIAIIAAIAIPNLMQSRIRANEATAVTVIKAYATAQVTFQVGRQGRAPTNTAATAGAAGFADNYRNLFYGNPVAAGTTVANTNLQLISQTHADAYAGTATDGGVATRNTPTAVTANPSAYQGYFFMSPTGLPAAVNGVGFFATQFAQVALPANSTSTGTNAYYVGIQGQVWMQGLTPNLPHTNAAVIGEAAWAQTPGGAAAAADLAAWITL